MSEDLVARARRFCARHSMCVLATQRPDGRARQSVVRYVFDDDAINVVTVGSFMKAKDVERTGWASACVVGTDLPFPSVTVEGRARLLREGISGLLSRFVQVRSEEGHFDGSQFETIDPGDIVVLQLKVDRAYGGSYLPAS